MSRQHRFSWDALWAWATERGLSMNELARRTGSDQRNLYRWREAGGVSDAAADRVAVKLGVTPLEIWGDEWLAVGLAGAEEAEARQRARHAEVERRRRERRPEVREANRQRLRAARAADPEWYRAARRNRYRVDREKERAQQRAYYQRTAEQQRARLRVYRERMKAMRPQSVDEKVDAVACGDGGKSPVNPHRSPSSAPHPEQRSLEDMDQLNQEVA